MSALRKFPRKYLPGYAIKKFSPGKLPVFVNLREPKSCGDSKLCLLARLAFSFFFCLYLNLLRGPKRFSNPIFICLSSLCDAIVFVRCTRGRRDEPKTNPFFAAGREAKQKSLLSRPHAWITSEHRVNTTRWSSPRFTHTRAHLNRREMMNREIFRWTSSGSCTLRSQSSADAIVCSLVQGNFFLDVRTVSIWSTRHAVALNGQFSVSFHDHHHSSASQYASAQHCAVNSLGWYVCSCMIKSIFRSCIERRERRRKSVNKWPCFLNNNHAVHTLVRTPFRLPERARNTHMTAESP